eukprot:GEMP01010706.1.p1 GENE.GEMP01010706.1~~GEMP01010706.1.p1  ORF type:complete len:788 (+),score=144.05 GEMP01010706.1:196-2559(+)
MFDACATRGKVENAADNGTFTKQQKPGNGAPIFHGIRVVDLSTILAAPLATGAMAYLGAEVIKVEDMNGDPLRTVMLALDHLPQKRQFSCIFESVNLNKKSVQMDLRESLDQLLSLLEDADVFVTNIRPSSLKRLKLDYESLRRTMPHLVYAHASAFGRSGPMADYAGYDAGAFWAMSGMGEKIMPHGCYGTYPIGFGDNTFSGGFLGGIAAGLYQRIKTGKGSLVDGSLIRMGAWCMMPYLNIAPHAPNKLRTYSTDDTPPWEDMNYCSYRTKDWEVNGDEIVVLGLGTTKVEAALNASTFDQAQQKFDNMTLAEAEELMHKHDVPFVRKQSMDSMAQYDKRCAQAFSTIPGVSDMEYTPVPPYNFSCSTKHCVAFRAPKLGEHNDATTWTPRHRAATLPKNADAGAILDVSSASPLQGIIVVELSSVHTACMATGAILRELGARVISIVTGDGLHYWRGRNAAYATQLQQGKEEVMLNLYSKEGRSEFRALIQGSRVFLTNFSKSQLEKYGLSDREVRAVCPKLIYCHIDTWLHEDFGNSEGALGAWYASSVAAGILRKMENAFPFFPTQLGELVASQHAAAACISAIFHRERTGEGQLCGTNLQHLGIWAISVFYVFLQKNPLHLPVFNSFAYKEQVQTTPLPLLNAFETKDGIWVMCLGLEVGRHLPKYYAAFNIKWSCIRSLGWAAFSEVLPKIFEKSLTAKVTPIFRTIHMAIREAIGSVTFAEFQDLSEKYDLWYVPVNTVESFLTTPQALLYDHIVPIKHSLAGWSVGHPVFWTANSLT